MREYLFRGKRIDNGEWVESGCIFKLINKSGDHFFIPKLGEKLIATHDDNMMNIVALENMTMYKVDPETAGQYAGLKDRNGVKIFEGDILEDSLRQELYTVNIGEYNQCDTCFDDEEKAAYGCYTVDSNGLEESIGHAHIWATVIGNIHDNPELLKEGGK